MPMPGGRRSVTYCAVITGQGALPSILGGTALFDEPLLLKSFNWTGFAHVTSPSIDDALALILLPHFWTFLILLFAWLVLCLRPVLLVRTHFGLPSRCITDQLMSTIMITVLLQWLLLLKFGLPWGILSYSISYCMLLKLTSVFHWIRTYYSQATLSKVAPTLKFDNIVTKANTKTFSWELWEGIGNSLSAHNNSLQ